MVQDFLFELGCEELPAGQLAPMAEHLVNAVKKALDTAKLQYGEIKAFYTPRRLALSIQNLQVKTEARAVERRGPAKIAAFDASGTKPSPALAGFLKSCNATVADLFEVKTDKGIWLAVNKVEPAVLVTTLLPQILSEAFKTLPLKKTMRWGSHDFAFLRPVHWIVALLGDAIVPLTLFEVNAGRVTYGHRFHHPAAIELQHAGDYQAALRDAYVLVDPAERRTQILASVKAIVPEGMAIKTHDVVLDEIVNLVEWPVALLCHFDAAFLSVPAAVLITTMETNQRVLPIINAEGSLQNCFITIANIASENPQAVIQGNEKVVRARLADAKFFYDADLKIPLENQLEGLKKITFQQGLGSVFDKVSRLEALVEGADAKQAARLCKADLLTQMVQEFPELQGYMGHHYALAQGIRPEIALALEDHYKPKTRGGDLPRNEIAARLALADKIDTLVGLFALDKAPSSSGDPFALRRQALGIITILVEQKWHVNLLDLCHQSYALYATSALVVDEKAVIAQLRHFFKERLEGWCRDEKGLPTVVVTAILNRRLDKSEDGFDVYAIFERIQALTALLHTAEGQALKELAKRISNILEEDKKALDEREPNASLYGKEEHALAALFTQVSTWKTLPLKEHYLAYLAFAPLISDFFDAVRVNDEDFELKQNRHALLRRVHSLFYSLADFKKL